jgi:hypothetical protein
VMTKRRNTPTPNNMLTERLSRYRQIKTETRTRDVYRTAVAIKTVEHGLTCCRP